MGRCRCCTQTMLPGYAAPLAEILAATFSQPGHPDYNATLYLVTAQITGGNQQFTWFGPGSTPTFDMFQWTSTPSNTNQQVGASADDGLVDGNGAINLTGSSIDLGGNAGPNTAYAWFRIASLPIPQGSIINSASVQPYFNLTTNSGGPSIYCEAADNSAPLTTAPTDLPNRVLTANSSAWLLSTVTSSGFQTSPDLTLLINEVVSRKLWASGNALSVVFKLPKDLVHSAPVATQDGGNGIKLTVKFTPPSGAQGTWTGRLNSVGISGSSGFDPGAGSGMTPLVSGSNTIAMAPSQTIDATLTECVTFQVGFVDAFSTTSGSPITVNLLSGPQTAPAGTVFSYNAGDTRKVGRYIGSGCSWTQGARVWEGGGGGFFSQLYLIVAVNNSAKLLFCQPTDGLIIGPQAKPPAVFTCPMVTFNTWNCAAFKMGCANAFVDGSGKRAVVVPSSQQLSPLKLGF